MFMFIMFFLFNFLFANLNIFLPFSLNNFSNNLTLGELNTHENLVP